MPKNLTYSETIEQVMLNNGYFAPLKLLYREIWKYKNRQDVAGKTTDNTIQERVQRDEKFTRIGLGIYALTDHLDKLSKGIEPKDEKGKVNRKHTEIQGMLLEIGNFRQEVQDTYTSDRRWVFENKMLSNLATLDIIPSFTYEKIIKESVNFCDVIWFNERGFPNKVFEVEHSTDFRGALIKFMELQDFIIEFYCIAPEDRKTKFEREKIKMLLNLLKID